MIKIKGRESITLYNKYPDPISKEDRYLITHIDNVIWNESKGANVLKSGLENADSTIITIFMATSDTNGKEYKLPKAWKNTPNVDIPNYFTLNTGDIIVKGITDYDINIGKLSGLQKTMDNVVLITQVDTQDRCTLMQRHWRVGAR